MQPMQSHRPCLEVLLPLVWPAQTFHSLGHIMKSDTPGWSRKVVGLCSQAFSRSTRCEHPCKFTQSIPPMQSTVHSSQSLPSMQSTQSIHRSPHNPCIFPRSPLCVRAVFEVHNQLCSPRNLRTVTEWTQASWMVS